MGSLIEALRTGHRTEIPLMERVLMEPEGSEDRLLVWHAWGSIITSKLVTVFPGNPRSDRPRPAVQALITAFDGETGTPTAVIDGTELTYWKTAASSGLAADMLAPARPETLVMVGAGALAPHLIGAHLAVRPTIRRVLIWNRTRAKAAALAEEMADTGVVAESTDHLEAAVRSAQVVSTATASSTPLIRGDWLRPGTHVDLVGGFTPTMREADDETVRRAAVFVDAAMFTIDHCGDISIPIANGTIDRSAVQTDLFGLCRGAHPGRTSDVEITLYKSGGGAHLDLMATEHVLRLL
jgi:alanine dehydrogenase